jgi:hypothetical protein
MTAVACLRVAVDATRVKLSPAALGPLVSRFSGSYLESRWRWPRLFQPLTHYSYLLTDPRADEMDLRELAQLADDLQTKLFGTGLGGDVGFCCLREPSRPPPLSRPSTPKLWCKP